MTENYKDQARQSNGEFGEKITPEPFEGVIDPAPTATCEECGEVAAPEEIRFSLCEECADQLICRGYDCDERNDNGEGYDGYCGNCADALTCTDCGGAIDEDHGRCDDCKAIMVSDDETVILSHANGDFDSTELGWDAIEVTAANGNLATVAAYTRVDLHPLAELHGATGVDEAEAWLSANLPVINAAIGREYPNSSVNPEDGWEDAKIYVTVNVSSEGWKMSSEALEFVTENGDARRIAAELEARHEFFIKDLSEYVTQEQDMSA